MRGSCSPEKGTKLEIIAVVLCVLLAITSSLLTLLILLHKGRGGGLSDMFGGGIGSNLGASGVAERNLNRITVVISTVWVISIVALNVIFALQTAGAL